MKKKGRVTLDICSSCCFHRKVWVSNPRTDWSSTRQYFVCRLHLQSWRFKRTTRVIPVSFLQHITSLNLYRSRKLISVSGLFITKPHEVNVLYLNSVSRVSVVSSHNHACQHSFLMKTFPDFGIFKQVSFDCFPYYLKLHRSHNVRS